MTTMLKKLRAAKETATWKERKAERKERRSGYDVVPTSYTSLPVKLPDDFLRPLDEEERKRIVVNKIKFEDTKLPEYKGCYALVLDNVLTEEECELMVGMAEMSAGGHGNAEGDAVVENDGWKPAMVNAGVGREFLATEYRNSDRIIWDEKEVVARLWKRVCQAEVVEEDIGLLEGEKWKVLLGPWAVKRGEKWRLLERGMNERMRFLRYGRGQFFKGMSSIFCLSLSPSLGWKLTQRYRTHRRHLRQRRRRTVLLYHSRVFQRLGARTRKGRKSTTKGDVERWRDNLPFNGYEGEVGC
jgi:hypothetical protein